MKKKERTQMTPEQSEKVKELESLGWITQTPPEGTFNGALLMEAPPDGRSYYICPDGTVSETQP